MSEVSGNFGKTSWMCSKPSSASAREVVDHRRGFARECQLIALETRSCRAPGGRPVRVEKSDECDRSQDRRRVAPDRSAMLAEDVDLAPQRVQRTRHGVPPVGVRRDGAERHPLAVTTDHDRRRRIGSRDRHRLGQPVMRAGVVDRAARPERPDDFDALDHLLDARPRRGKVEAIRPVLVLHPTGAVAEDELATAQVLQRRGHLREQCRMAIRVGHHDRAEQRLRKSSRDPRQLGPAFETEPILGHEVVGDPTRTRMPAPRAEGRGPGRHGTSPERRARSSDRPSVGCSRTRGAGDPSPTRRFDVSARRPRTRRWCREVRLVRIAVILTTDTSRIVRGGLTSPRIVDNSFDTPGL